MGRPRPRPGYIRAAAASAASGTAPPQAPRLPAVSGPAQACRPPGSPCFWGFTCGNRGIGLVYSLAYHKGRQGCRPEPFPRMNDRSKKAISTPALELARKVLAIEADAVSALISRLDRSEERRVGKGCRARWWA